MQAAFDIPQFQEKVSGAVRAVMLSSEFMDAIAARVIVTLAQQPVMQQLLQQTSPVPHAPYVSFFQQSAASWNSASTQSMAAAARSLWWLVVVVA